MRRLASRASWVGHVALVVLLLSGLACGSSGNSALAPRFQPEVTNSPDNFQFQTTGVTGVTQVLTYSWTNTGTQATIDQSCALTNGSATLRLRDSKGVQVYLKDLTANGSFVSAVGDSGTWEIRVSLTGVSGTLNFRVQKKA